MTPTAASPRRRTIVRTVVLLLAALTIAAAFVAGDWLVRELESGESQSRWLSRWAGDMRFSLEDGPSPAIRFPRDGPYDQRMGYSGLDARIARIESLGFEVVAQARQSPAMLRLQEHEIAPPYRIDPAGGLRIEDCARRPLQSSRWPQRTYPGFEAVPDVVTRSLLYIENRHLLDPDHPTRNPAYEWRRLARALVEQAHAVVDPDRAQPGGSTLATQIEKFRHSPGGRTESVTEKGRQMLSASLRAYLDGPDTTEARRRIVVDYLNGVPLAARAGFGEVIGVGDALWAWYGRDFDEVNRLLADASAPLGERAIAFRQVLSLLVSERRPSWYLGPGRARLREDTDTYLRLLAGEGVIDDALRDAALAATAEPIAVAPASSQPMDFVARKALNAVRSRLMHLTAADSLYALDRLDLQAASTLHQPTQREVSERLARFAQPDGARAAGLTAPGLLGSADPSQVTYSFVLFERGEDRHRLRVQADSLDQPFDINDASKLDLGSTAKLRVLVHYLETVAALHARLAGLDADALRRTPVAPDDAITRWAVDWLASAPERGLAPMLEAALERRYSADPSSAFFTGGAVHRFRNFSAKDNGRVPTVREAMRDSVNLPFVRLLRDLVRHSMSGPDGTNASLLLEPGHPGRRPLLERYADQEGQTHLERYWARHAGQTPAEAERQLAQRAGGDARRVVAAFRAMRPDGDLDALLAFAERTGAAAPAQALREAFAAPEWRRFDLQDLGYLARAHPLELWLVGWRNAHPDGTLAQAIDASRDARLAAHRWLFETRRKSAQDRALRIVLEQDAFETVHAAWQRLGYPFEQLVPSYATALGASADRPAALAELMGVLVADGRRAPAVRIERLRFAEGTPYETVMARRPEPPQQVLPPEVARAALGVLGDVVESGTARRARGSLTSADGTALAIGGKTGTGERRMDRLARSGERISSRTLARSGTFVFHLGDRWFGTVTAHVQGPDAERYHFTSGLTVQVLRELASALQPLVAPADGVAACADPAGFDGDRAPARPAAGTPAPTGMRDSAS